MIVRVAAVQFRVRPVTRFEDFARQVSEQVERAASKQATHIVFPEYFTAGLILSGAGNVSSEGMESLFRGGARECLPLFDGLMSDLSRRHGVFLIAGTLFYHHREEDRYFNASFIYTPEGKRFEQRKVHPTYELVYNRRLVSGGNSLDVFDLGGLTVGVPVCYDIQFPEYIRILRLRGADVLAVPGCVFDEWGIRRLLTAGAARALENQIYLVNCHVVGDLPIPVDRPYRFCGRTTIQAPVSALLECPTGVLEEAPQNEEAIVICALDLDLLRRQREEGLPKLDDRRPELYGEILSGPKA